MSEGRQRPEELIKYNKYILSVITSCPDINFSGKFYTYLVVPNLIWDKNQDLEEVKNTINYSLYTLSLLVDNIADNLDFPEEQRDFVKKLKLDTFSKYRTGSRGDSVGTDAHILSLYKEFMIAGTDVREEDLTKQIQEYSMKKMDEIFYANEDEIKERANKYWQLIKQNNGDELEQKIGVGLEDLKSKSRGR